MAMTPSTPTENGPIPKIGQGNITFQLDGESYELKPTVNAMRVLSHKYGGLQDVLDKLVRSDVQTVEDVIVMGLGPKYQGSKVRMMLMDKIFAAGLTDDTGGFALICQKYVISLLRGGRPMPESKEAQDEEAAEPAKGNALSSN